MWEEFPPEFSPLGHVRRLVMTGWEIKVEIKVNEAEEQTLGRQS